MGDADAIIAEVVARYAHVEVYEDTGDSVFTRFASRVSFATAFNRTRQSFSFDATFLTRDQVDWERRIRASGDVVEVEGAFVSGENRSLGDAVAASTGITFGAAHIVPRLLMPARIGGRGLFEGRVPRLRDEVIVLDGRRCLVIHFEGRVPMEQVCIDVSTHAVRRVEMLETQIDYDVRVFR